MITAAEALAAQLESYSARYVFGTCGHTNIALLDALSRSTIRFVIARHEQAAAHAADGYARVSGKPGVLLLHVGPGMMNAVSGVATAALDSVPLVAISGYGCEFRDPGDRPYSPDFAALARACGADGYLIAAPDDLRTALREALSRPPGRRRPAVLDVPMINEPVPTPGHWNITDIYRGVFDLPHFSATSSGG
jgi:thiamine pyrophosphate-dependent acetolactate synthase large subunit-like protein